MKIQQARRWIGMVVAMVAITGQAEANERYFTYTYEPETMPQGAMEFEQWVTLRAGRNAKVGKEDFNKWQLREELEYGVTDNYTAALYLNTAATSFRTPSGSDSAEFEFEGVSLENRYMVLNPAEHPVGLALYFEPRYSGQEAELEEKLILGQRVGDWKWAFNVVHATEWTSNLHGLAGEFELDFGLTRALTSHLSAGIEVRNHNELPEYHTWEHTAFFVGPVLTYRQERWWLTLTVMPQVFGRNFHGDPDGQRALVLDEHERVNARLIVGFDF